MRVTKHIKIIHTPINFFFKFSAYTRPFVVTVMTDPDEGPLGSATDKANRGFNLVRFL